MRRSLLPTITTIRPAVQRALAAVRATTPHLPRARLLSSITVLKEAHLLFTRRPVLAATRTRLEMPLKRAASGKAKRKLEERESPDPDTGSSIGTESDAEPKAKGRASKKAKVDTGEAKSAGKTKTKGKAKSADAQEGAKEDGDGSTSALAPNGQPTNKVMPVQVSFPPREEGRVRISTWNICGLAAAQKKVRSHDLRMLMQAGRTTHALNRDSNSTSRRKIRIS